MWKVTGCPAACCVPESECEENLTAGNRKGCWESGGQANVEQQSSREQGDEKRIVRALSVQLRGS